MPPPTRKVACRLTVTYAGFSGESVLLEELYARGMAQPQIAPSLRAGDGMLMAWHHEPIAPWQTPEWLDQMRRSLRPNQYRRMIENHFVLNTKSFHRAVGLGCLCRCRRVAGNRRSKSGGLLRRRCSLEKGQRRHCRLRLGCQGSESAAGVAPHFMPSPGSPIDFESDIETALLDVQRRFSVRKVPVDPHMMQASLQRLARRGVPVEEYPQNTANVTAASQNLFELVTGQNLVAYPDAAIRLAVSQAVAVEGPRGWKIDKSNPRHKIDVVVGLAMACKAAVDNQMVGPPLWSQAAFLVNGEAVPVPKMAGLLFAVIAQTKTGDVGVCYFAHRHLAPLCILAVERPAHLTPGLFASVKRRLEGYAATMAPPSGAVVFTNKPLADMARGLRFGGIEVCDDIFGDDLIVEKAAALVVAGNVKACADVVASAGVAFLHGLADSEDPSQCACMAGVILAMTGATVVRAA